MKKLTQAAAEKAVVRAAMRWYRTSFMEIIGYTTLMPSEATLAKACIAYRATKKKRK